MNNFKEYGFKADFEGEILKQIRDTYIGYVFAELNIVSPISWTNDGVAYGTNDLFINKSLSKYNLKPIKKEWYENPDNFPCLVIDNNKKILYVNKYKYTKENNTHWAIYEEMGEDIYSLNLEYHRPATKEEVLELVIKE